MEPKEKSKNGKVLAISQGLQVKIDKDLKWKSSLTRYSGEEDKPAESHQQTSDQSSSLDSKSNISNILVFNLKTNQLQPP